MLSKFIITVSLCLCAALCLAEPGLAENSNSKTKQSAKSGKKTTSGKAKKSRHSAQDADSQSDSPQLFSGLNLQNGFRSLKWGASVGSVSGLELREDGGPEKVYARKKENLSINQAKAREIVYVFCQGKLAGGMVLYEGIANFNRLKQEVQDALGEQTMADFLQGRYEWNVEKLLVLMEYSAGSDSGGLACYYEPTYGECAALHSMPSSPNKP